MDRLLVGSEYASHLTDADLALLASAAAGQGVAGGSAGPVDASRLRGDPAVLLRLLEHPGVSRAVLGEGDAGPGRAVPASRATRPRRSSSRSTTQTPPSRCCARTPTASPPWCSSRR